MKTRHLVLTLALIAVAVAPASAEWVVNADGRCVEVWSADALERGPLAIADSPLVPVRYAGGAVEELREPSEPGYSGDSNVLRALYTPLAAVTALQDSFARATLGVMDVLTGGFFDLAGDEPNALTTEATPLGVLGPLDPPALVAHPRDECGREVYPLAVSRDAELYSPHAKGQRGQRRKGRRPPRRRFVSALLTGTF